MLFSRRGPGRIPASEAHRLLRDGTAVMIDVREADEFRAGHAPGAMHVPLSRLAHDGAVGLPEARRLVLVCRSGNRSRRAAALLAAQGVNCVDMAGGMLDWAAEGLPVRDARGSGGTVI